MTPAEFLKALRENPRTHFYVVTPDGGGMVRLVPRILRAIAAAQDVRIVDGASLTVTLARRLAQEAGMAPVAGGAVTHFVIWRAETLGAAAAAALLYAVEESPRGRFVFVSSQIPQGALRPLASRCSRVSLPFLSKRAVLGNLQALREDARMAADKDLWDGTLGGTLANIREVNVRAQILAAIAQGMQGLPDLVAFADSPVFDRVLAEHLTAEERSFLERDSSPERRKLVAFSLLSRRTA